MNDKMKKAIELLRYARSLPPNDAGGYEDNLQWGKDVDALLRSLPDESQKKLCENCESMRPGAEPICPGCSPGKKCWQPRKKVSDEPQEQTPDPETVCEVCGGEKRLKGMGNDFVTEWTLCTACQPVEPKVKEKLSDQIKPATRSCAGCACIKEGIKIIDDLESRLVSANDGVEQGKEGLLDATRPIACGEDQVAEDDSEGMGVINTMIKAFQEKQK